MSSDKDDPNTLLGDLESIRSLLEEPEDASDQGPTHAGRQAGDSIESSSDDDVPTLDDVVTGALELSETGSSGSLDTASSLDSSLDSGKAAGEDGLDDETIRALLDDEWRERAGNLLGAARDDIESNSELWQPEYTDELGNALQVRIDSVVHDWIATTLNNHIDSLRQALISALQSELDDQLRRHLGSEGGNAEGGDNPNAG